ncbi:MAG: hypothetical protein HoeaKO_14670 [Hoeflea alexandrii]
MAPNRLPQTHCHLLRFGFGENVMLINMLARTELLLESPLHLILTGIICFWFIERETLSMVVGVTHPVLSANAFVDSTAMLRIAANIAGLDKVTTFTSVNGPTIKYPSGV